MLNEIGSPKQTAVGAENDESGLAFTVIIFVVVCVDVHPPLVPVTVTEYVPGVVYVCDGVPEENTTVPSPKSHVKELALVDVLVNVIASGEHPLKGDAVKLIVGVVFTVTVCDDELVHPLLDVAVIVTV